MANQVRSQVVVDLERAVLPRWNILLGKCHFVCIVHQVCLCWNTYFVLLVMCFVTRKPLRIQLAMFGGFGQTTHRNSVFFVWCVNHNNICVLLLSIYIYIYIYVYLAIPIRIVSPRNTPNSILTTTRDPKPLLTLYISIVISIYVDISISI